MLALTLATHIFEVVTTSTARIDYTWSACDIDATTGAVLDDLVSGEGSITSITTVQVVPAPAANVRRQLKHFSMFNAGTAANSVTFQKDVSGAQSPIARYTFQPGEWADFMDTAGWKVRNRAGTERLETSEDRISGQSYLFHKVGTAAEAIGQWYCWSKDAGTPGAWAPGTPGVAGRATDGTTAADAGCLPIPNAASGANYVTGMDGVSSAVGQIMLMDFLWVNSGITVTTVGAQTINSVEFPARDVLGTVNGVGCEIAILVTTATTNAGAFANLTMSYTNSNGVAGRTATLANFPATAGVGTLVFMQLQAGDVGVQSIQSITLGTSLVTGAISVLLTRTLCSRADAIANVGSTSYPSPNIDPRAGVRIHNGACLLLAGMRPATTATNIYGNVFVANK